MYGGSTAIVKIINQLPNTISNDNWFTSVLKKIQNPH